MANQNAIYLVVGGLAIVGIVLAIAKPWVKDGDENGNGDNGGVNPVCSYADSDGIVRKAGAADASVDYFSGIIDKDLVLRVAEAYEMGGLCSEY